MGGIMHVLLIVCLLVGDKATRQGEPTILISAKALATPAHPLQHLIAFVFFAKGCVKAGHDQI
jgi:hypothetical protein